MSPSTSSLSTMAKSPISQFNLSILFFIFSLLFVSSSSLFTAIDNYLINCGSSSTVDLDNRIFNGDESLLSDSVFLSATRTISLTSSGHSSPIYNSVRIFTKPSIYTFKIKEKGAHLVRLHFHRFNSSKFDLSNAQFHVIVNGYLLLLNNFDGFSVKDVEIREYVLWVDSDMLEILFTPLKKSKFGFVNAIEVISAPKDLILDVAQFVDSNGVSKIDGLLKNAYQTMFRVSVGGPKVTPFNDSLWRTWIPDNEYFKPSYVSKKVHFSGRIKYQVEGASREIAPDNVYSSARLISGSNSNVSRYNLSWVFPVSDGYKYLVRTHFCDITSPTFDSLFLNVYVNGYLAYEKLNFGSLANGLASPFYADFVVDGGDNGVLTVSVGPSNWSLPSGIDAILNGLEVFKLNNSMDSFDGLVSSASILRKCRGGDSALLTLLAAVIGLLVAASVVLRKRFMSMRDSVPWTRLPLAVSEVDLKSSYRFSSRPRMVPG